MDIHRQVADGTSGAELDLGVPPANARKAVDTVNDDRVSAAGYALNGDRVATQARHEAISLFGPGRPACDGLHRGQE
jgi:hypothetical protein